MFKDKKPKDEIFYEKEPSPELLSGSADRHLIVSTYMREKFAAQAMAGLASRPPEPGVGWNPKHLATQAVALADALITELTKNL